MKQYVVHPTSNSTNYKTLGDQNNLQTNVSNIPYTIRMDSNLKQTSTSDNSLSEILSSLSFFLRFVALSDSVSETLSKSENIYLLLNIFSKICVYLVVLISQFQWLELKIINLDLFETSAISFKASSRPSPEPPYPSSFFYLLFSCESDLPLLNFITTQYSYFQKVRRDYSLQPEYADPDP